MSDTVEIDEEELNRICWIVVYGSNDDRNHAQYAENCIEEMEDSDEVDDLSYAEAQYEYGYHAGIYVFYEDMIEQLETLGIDVQGRAEKYVTNRPDEDITISYDKDALKWPSSVQEDE